LIAVFEVEFYLSAQNSILPSRPFSKPSSRRTMGGVERPKSQVLESSNFTPRGAPSSARQTPRGASASTMKKWGSTEGLLLNTVPTNAL